MSKHQAPRNANNVKHANVLRRIQRAIQTVKKMYDDHQPLYTPQAETTRRKALDLAAQHIRLLEECQLRFGSTQSKRCLENFKDYRRIPVEERSGKTLSGDAESTHSSWYGHSLWGYYSGMKDGVECGFSDDVGYWADEVAAEPRTILLDGTVPAAKASKQVEWDPDDNNYMPVSKAIEKLATVELSLHHVSRELTPDGQIAYMRKGRRCRVHIGEFLKEYDSKIAKKLIDKVAEKKAEQQTARYRAEHQKKQMNLDIATKFLRDTESQQ